MERWRGVGQHQIEIEIKRDGKGKKKRENEREKDKSTSCRHQPTHCLLMRGDECKCLPAGDSRVSAAKRK